VGPIASDLVDTDGDGLTDTAEQRGWTIAIKRTNGDIVVRSVTSDPGDPRLPLDSLRNAAARDTDADGIGDLDELHYGIDPRNVVGGDEAPDRAPEGPRLTPAQAAQLPPGTSFLDMNGNRRTRR
jgi:hypothetical protein